MTTKFSINWNDILQSLKTGIFTTIVPIIITFFAPLYVQLQAGQIPDFSAINWHLLQISLVGGFTTFFGSVIKRFLQDESGNLGLGNLIKGLLQNGNTSTQPTNPTTPNSP